MKTQKVVQKSGYSKSISRPETNELIFPNPTSKDHMTTTDFPNGFPITSHIANELRDVCHSAAFNAGWWNVQHPGRMDDIADKVDIRDCPPHVLAWWIGTKIALCHSELSEALEGLRKDTWDQHLPHLKAIDVELADTVIRIMDLAGGLQIDIGRAIVEKMAFNAVRQDHKVENRDAAGGKVF